MTNPVIYAAAYLLLLGQPVQAPGPTPIATTVIECQLPPAPGTCPRGQDCDASGRPISGHLSVIRAVAHLHHRHGHHRGRHHHR